MNLLENFLQPPSKKPAATSHSAAPAVSDAIASAEERLARQEAALVETQAKLSAQGQSLADRLAAARSVWAQARTHGASVDSALEARLSSAIPQVSIARELQAAQAARAAAVQQRQDSVKSATALLGALEKNLAALEAQLEQDSRLLQQVSPATQVRRVAAPSRADEDGSLDKTLIRAMAEAESAVPLAVEPAVKAMPKAAPKPRLEPRRAAPRVALVAEVDVSSDTNFFNGYSTDIADGGLFVATCSLLPIGSTVDINFSLPNGKRIEAKGEVRWVRELDERNPVRFVELSAGAAAAINGFVAEREPMFFPD
jgi:uncharacterized protein (TIGR02266 family)